MRILPGISAAAMIANAVPLAEYSPAPVIVGATNSGIVSSPGPLVVDLGSFSAGDLLVVMGDKTNGGGATTVVAGTGWTLAQDIYWASGDRTFILWKIAVGGDTLSLNWGGTNWCGARAFVIQGHDPAVAPITTSAGGGDVPEMLMPGSMLLNNALVLVGASQHPSAPATLPAGYTSQGNPQRCNIGSKEIVEAALENPGAYTGSSAACVGIIIAAIEAEVPVSLGKYTVRFTGTEKNLYVGSGISKIKVKLWGGGANGGYYSGGVYGGGGGYTEAEFNVAEGDKITVQAAKGGSPGAAIKAYPDGGPGSYGDTNGSGGGGSTRVWINEEIHAVAGGGGGAAGFVGWGGLGGGTNGGAGSAGPGGTQTAPGYVGGAAGLYTYLSDPCGQGGGSWRNGATGVLAWANRNCQRGGYGGVQGGSTGDDGGGGGGGYYGGAGGGGDGRSGGGGSGFVKSTALSSTMLSGLHNAAIESANVDYPGGSVALSTVSNSGQFGGNGAVVIEFSA